MTEVFISMKKIKKYLKKYKSIFDKILSNYQFVTIEDNQLLFQGEGKDHVIIKMDEKNPEELIVQEAKNNYYREIRLCFPERLNDLSIITEETIIQERKKGVIVEKNQRTYRKNIFSSNDYGLTDLESTRYVINNESEVRALRSEENLGELSELTTTFSVHMPYTITEEQKVPIPEIDSPSIKLNGVDISSVYEKIGGSGKIDRIFDLYRGIITKDNLKDLDSIHLGILTEYAYDYKAVAGISVIENALVGKEINPFSEKKSTMIKDFITTKTGYQKPFDITDRYSLIKALKYIPTPKENASQILQETLGMTYEEFDDLDFDEQQTKIEEYQRRNPKTESEYVTVMIGSGEHAIFQKVKRGTKVLIGNGRHSCFVTMGISSEENRTSPVVEQNSKLHLKQKVKEKLNGFLKKEQQ